MQITIITIPLCLLLYNYSESLNMYYIVYSLLVCIAGGTIYNIFTDIEQDNDDIVTTTWSEVKPTTATVPEPVTDTEPESTVETVLEPVTDTEPDSTTEAVPDLTADTYSDIEHNTGIIDDDDNPEPLKISDILPEVSATNETGNCGMGDNNTDNDIYNMLPVPRPIVPYGLSEKSIIIRDYQNNTNKDQIAALESLQDAYIQFGGNFEVAMDSLSESEKSLIDSLGLTDNELANLCSEVSANTAAVL